MALQHLKVVSRDNSNKAYVVINMAVALDARFISMVHVIVVAVMHSVVELGVHSMLMVHVIVAAAIYLDAVPVSELCR